MSDNTIKYNIKLQEQPSYTITKVSPSQEWLTDNHYTVNSSDYEEFTFTGNEAEVKDKRDAYLNDSGQHQISTTLTRLNGNLWQLQVRQSPLVKQAEEEQEESPEEKEHGSKDNPKQLSISITAIQESVLNHAKYANLTPQQRGAIKAYMNGAMEGQKVADANGQAIRLGQIMPMSDSLVQLALKCPSYYVPSIAVTYQYYSGSAVTDAGEIGQPKNPPGMSKLPEGYTSLFMGCSSSPQGKGYIIQESYTIGKFNTELTESSGK